MIQTNFCFNIPRRAFSASRCLYRRKRKPSLFAGKPGHVPFDPRLPVTGKHVGSSVEGGSDEAQRLAALHVVHPTGYHHPVTGRFIQVKEMIPEFIVPDLTDCKLKPYVPYNVQKINQSKLTAKDIFDECYAEDVSLAYKQGMRGLQGETSKNAVGTGKREQSLVEENKTFAELRKKAESK